jgi:hypothetical protein
VYHFSRRWVSCRNSWFSWARHLVYHSEWGISKSVGARNLSARLKYNESSGVSLVNKILSSVGFVIGIIAVLTAHDLTCDMPAVPSKHMHHCVRVIVPHACLHLSPLTQAILWLVSGLVVNSGGSPIYTSGVRDNIRGRITKQGGSVVSCYYLN